MKSNGLPPKWLRRFSYQASMRIAWIALGLTCFVGFPLAILGIIYLFRYDECLDKPIAVTGLMCSGTHRALVGATIFLTLMPFVAYFSRLMKRIMNFHGVTKESLERDKYR